MAQPHTESTEAPTHKARCLFDLPSAPTQVPPQLTTPTSPASPFLPISLGFPRLIHPFVYSSVDSISPHITIPDVIITVLYNHGMFYEKRTLEAFLDFLNTEFYFVRTELAGGAEPHFHIERDGNVVLCGHQYQPDDWKDRYIYRVDPSGVWRPLAMDGDELSPVPHKEHPTEITGFVANVLGRAKWLANPPNAIIDVAVKHAI